MSHTPTSLTALVLIGVLLHHVGCELTQHVPSLVSEPPSLVQYAATRGVRVRCAAKGDPNPAISWIADDGTPINDRPGVRRVFNNGTLEMLPTNSYLGVSGSGAGGDGAVTLRCRAANPHGVVLSKDITLQPVSEMPWEPMVTGVAAAAGGVAALTCSATHHTQYVRVAAWYHRDRLLTVDAPAPESRYIMAGNSLLIRGASPADAGPYTCLARHSLSGHTKRSAPAILTLAPSGASTAPRLLPAPTEFSVPAGADVCLPCVASDHPAPHYTWYREWGGRLQPVEAGGAGGAGGGSGGVWWWAGGAALCLRGVTRAAAGAWLCKAYNVLGDATVHTSLHVADTLRVVVAPLVLVADTGSTVRFNCSASEAGASLSWVHDGAAAGAGSELLLRGVARAHRGAYQCFARLAHDAAHATAELRLGESAPELHYTFIEQALRAGGGVSLRCAASGSPAPRFTWLLDDQPLDQYRAQHRYAISTEGSVSGDVVSVLNVSAASAADGGRYTCRAHNHLGRADHSARLNIYGPPSIRALAPVRVVAGANATLYCPYAGYPISSISWWRRGAGVAVGGAGRVSARGAELRLTPALPSDAGHYACAVAAPAGPAARQDVQIQVRNPPKISPFIFSSELTEGSSVQVLCGVSSGDKPMYFSWVKDGAPLPANLQIEEKSLNEFSLLMFSELTARHSGDYTCRVSNHAATVNYTATLSVKVAPAWTTEPLDAAVLLGAPLQLHCAASGHPPPVLTWYRRIGEVGALSTDNGEQWEVVSGGEWGGGGGSRVGGGGTSSNTADTDTTLRVTNGTLYAGAAARPHQGLYRCAADNGVGPPLLKHVNITVHEPAHFEGGEGNVSCVRGRSAALVCHARGDAPLSLHWTHRGVRLDLTSYRWTVSEVRIAGGVRSTLQVRAAERADAGDYRCHATNQFGRSELLLYLHVEEPPEAPRGVRLGGVGARWARVVWRAASATHRYTALCTALHSLPGAEPPHSTHNLTLDATLDDKVETEGLRPLAARLEGLHPAVAYSLRLAATNHVGQSPHSEPLIFTTLDEPPAGTPQNVRVRPANSGELHVSWLAPPQDTWNGELLGYVVSWRELTRFDDEEEETGEVGDGEELRRAGTDTAPGWSTAELTITGLRPAARYAVTLRAYNRAGAGPSAPQIYATTPDGVPEVSPRRVTCEAVSARSVRVRWAPPAHAHAHALRGYDLHLLPVHFPTSWSSAAEAQTARTGLSGEATLQGLRAATNYSVWVRARADRGLGPPSPPVYCSTLEDAPGPVEAVRALPTATDAVRVTWLAPAHRAGRLTHYTLYIRELGKVGGEWSQRVDATAPDGDDEALREVRGLREGTVYEFWVRAATAAGASPPSRPVTAAPAPLAAARISSVARVVSAVWGSRARLRCSAVGVPPLRWRWTPLPRAHTLTDTGDLIIHKVEASSAGNYTCSVRNGIGTDATLLALVVRRAPAAPSPRLTRAEPHALLLAWDPPPDTGVPLLSYSVSWERAGSVSGTGGGGSGARSRALPSSDTSLWLWGLRCGALYRVTVRAHNALGASPPSRALLAPTRGDKAKPPPGKEAVWANSTALRLNLLAWGGRCAVRAWQVELRLSTGGVWSTVPGDGETAEAGGLRPGTWYEVRVTARAFVGDTIALYRAATHTTHGERLGEPVEVRTEERRAVAEEAGSGAVGDDVEGAASGGMLWRAALAPALLAAGLAALLLVLAGTAVVRRRQAWCWRRSCSLHQPRRPHPQLYTTEPGKRNGKTLTPPDGELHEISPYATFSMSGGVADADGSERAPAGETRGGGGGGGGGAGGGGAAGCALHLHTFGRAESLDLAAPPPRPNLLSHSAEYGRCRDSDSESSGSPCAACAAEHYRLPAAHRTDTLPAVESSADDTSYSGGGGGGGGGGGSRRATRAPRRRTEHARHVPEPTVRYTAGRSARAALVTSERAPI